jgi:hypothetical protein
MNRISHWTSLLSVFFVTGCFLLSFAGETDWEARGKAIWTFTDGGIQGGQNGNPAHSGLLISKKDFRDFEMRFEFLLDEHGKYNSGVYFRFDPEKKGPRLQLNLGRGAADEPVGLYLDEWLDRGDEKDEFRRPSEWNDIRLRVSGSHIEAWLNGNQIVDFEDAERMKPYLTAGRVAFQTYGAEGHAGWVKFRNVSITEM